jgi:hypothetical protein
MLESDTFRNSTSKPRRKLEFTTGGYLQLVPGDEDGGERAVSWPVHREYFLVKTTQIQVYLTGGQVRTLDLSAYILGPTSDGR